MNERTKQFRVGVIVFATMLLTSMLILWNSDFSSLPFRGKYQVVLRVDQAPGVAPDTPVRRRGLPIGRVAAIEDTDDSVLITLNIDDGKIVKTNEIGRIQSSLVGDAIIEFVPARSPLGATPVAAGQTIDGMYAPNPVDLLATLQGDLRQSIVSLGQAGEEVAELADRLNTVLGAGDMQRITRLVESTEQAMAQFAEVARNVNDVVQDPEFKQQLKSGLAQIPSVMSDARAILEALESAVTSADQNLKNLQGLTGPLGDRGVAIVDALENSVRNLEELLAQVALLTRNLNGSEGTFGLLLRERESYDRLNATLAEAQGAIADVRFIVNNEKFLRRLEQILDNVWVLTDKLARDPARVLRGVANRETPLNPIGR
ncbi:MAG TPA: MlaD family protein [Lacipirellulaceae bacterium]|nr:MlaD family protein [Lacipirellulaceae bacterium]